MKTIFVPSALLLTAIAAVFLNAPKETAAFVCLPGFCDNVTCPKITKCNGIFCDRAFRGCRKPPLYVEGYVEGKSSASCTGHVTSGEEEEGYTLP
ncbi:hypothetical protein HPB47_027617 [Ixodes persulcatus]|uniref:Uncharacterized protein n=1 Tax=Ixodes persulcatus TaxID=34615 RepID=A0AC60PXT3_IXOPE|nr:hypothetical protein HPB47_027617 [Ixodes persulcatus]